MKKSALQRVRSNYIPKLPKALQGPVTLKIGASTMWVADQVDIQKVFHNTSGIPFV